MEPPFSFQALDEATGTFPEVPLLDIGVPGGLQMHDGLARLQLSTQRPTSSLSSVFCGPEAASLCRPRRQVRSNPAFKTHES
jgi:hypothetical protein